MAFPDWLPIEYPGVFDPDQIIDDALPEPYVMEYNDEGLGGIMREVLPRTMNAAEVQMATRFGSFEIRIVHHRTHAMGMIDYIA